MNPPTRCLITVDRYTLGETRLTPQGYFHAELRGLSQPLAQSTLEVFSPNCRADLGHERCKFPIEPPELVLALPRISAISVPYWAISALTPSSCP